MAQKSKADKKDGLWKSNCRFAVHTLELSTVDDVGGIIHTSQAKTKSDTIVHASVSEPFKIDPTFNCLFRICWVCVEADAHIWCELMEQIDCLFEKEHVVWVT